MLLLHRTHSDPLWSWFNSEINLQVDLLQNMSWEALIKASDIQKCVLLYSVSIHAAVFHSAEAVFISHWDWVWKQELRAVENKLRI